MFQNLSHDLTTINKSKTHFTSACVDEKLFLLTLFYCQKIIAHFAKQCRKCFRPELI